MADTKSEPKPPADAKEPRTSKRELPPPGPEVLVTKGL